VPATVLEAAPHGESVMLAEKLTPVGLIPTRALEVKNWSRFIPGCRYSIISP